MGASRAICETVASTTVFIILLVLVSLFLGKLDKDCFYTSRGSCGWKCLRSSTDSCKWCSTGWVSDLCVPKARPISANASCGTFATCDQCISVTECPSNVEASPSYDQNLGIILGCLFGLLLVYVGILYLIWMSHLRRRESRESEHRINVDKYRVDALADASQPLLYQHPESLERRVAVDGDGKDGSDDVIVQGRVLDDPGDGGDHRLPSLSPGPDSYYVCHPKSSPVLQGCGSGGCGSPARPASDSMSAAEKVSAQWKSWGYE